MPDPQYIVHSTAYEHNVYAKAQKQEKLIGSLWAIVLGCAGCYALYYFAWEYVH